MTDVDRASARQLWRRTLLRFACGSAALMMAATIGAAPPVHADTWPSKPVKIIVPFATGGITTLMARIVADRLGEVFGQPFVIENKPGGGGRIGAEQVARSDPDGYTLVISSLGGFIILPYFSPGMSQDPVTDFSHIAYLGGPPGILVVNKDLPVRSLADFVQYAKAQRTALSYGTALTGSHSQLIAEILQQKAGIKMDHVPYRGSAQILTDVAGGHLPAGSLTLGSAAGQVKGGLVRAIAITTKERLAEFPDVPTYEEQGYSGMVASTWFGLSGPANMPPDIVRRINAEAVKALQSSKIRERLQSEGIESTPFDATAFTAFFKSEKDRWSPIAARIADSVHTNPDGGTPK